MASTNEAALHSKDVVTRERTDPSSSNPPQHNEDSAASKTHYHPPPHATAHEEPEPEGASSRSKVPGLPQEKEQEWTEIARRKRPLQLLDLPLDILRAVLREVTHTNDLTTLAQTCSAIHALVIPLIYGRFDIVWPDASGSTEPRSGVDALTYGLATLVMREDLFLGPIHSSTATPSCDCRTHSCVKCGTINYLPKSTDFCTVPSRPRRGNYFSQFTKTFSLGNGPEDWVSDYLITKESGKMLGTLICLAIARMPNLESFIWDMPTGILRDIWGALSSLGDLPQPRLSKVWIRFHNQKAALEEMGLPYRVVSERPFPCLANTSTPLPDTLGFPKIEWLDLPIETPNISTLPPLRSLTVLGIDEVSYLEELSKLIGRSRHKLRELRVGVASKVHVSGYKPTDNAVQCLCLGGLLGLLFDAIDGIYNPGSKFYIHRTLQQLSTDPPSFPDDETKGHLVTHCTPNIQAVPCIEDFNAAPDPQTGADHSEHSLHASTTPVNSPVTAPNPPNLAPSSVFEHPLDDVVERPPETLQDPVQGSTGPSLRQAVQDKIPSDSEPSRSNLRNTPGLNDRYVPPPSSTFPDGRLRLDLLEIDGCQISMRVFRKTIDFSTMTTLTILNCALTNTFWSEFGKHYSPLASRSSRSASLLSPKGNHPPPKSFHYPLKLRRIHTDKVTAGLIQFLKTSLAPNSLEWLFLQDSSITPSTVTAETIVKGPIRHHRASLTKLLIDSSVGSLNSRPSISSASKWMLDHELLTYITSGKLMKLRELGVVLDHKDWHFLLQRLPKIPHLRSLYIPYILNHPYGGSMNLKEVAMTVLDIVSLRPELELSYLGLAEKCFEIREKRTKTKQPQWKASPSQEEANGSSDDDDDENAGTTNTNPAPADQTSDDDDDDDDDNDNQAEAEADTEDEWSLSEEDEHGQDHEEKTTFKLREILYYDDKVSIFKARHGKL